MPYVYRDELGEGELEADVVTRDEFTTVETERDLAVIERDEAFEERDGLIAERDNLAKELDNAKTKFANAFLSSPEKMKRDQNEDVKDDSTIKSFDQLFSGRNKHNAN